MWRSEAASQLMNNGDGGRGGGRGGGVGEQSYEMYMPGQQQAGVLYEKQQQSPKKDATTNGKKANDIPAEQREHHFEQSSAVGAGADADTAKADIKGGDALGGSAQGKTRHIMSLPTVLGTTGSKAAPADVVASLPTIEPPNDSPAVAAKPVAEKVVHQTVTEKPIQTGPVMDQRGTLDQPTRNVKQQAKQKSSDSAPKKPPISPETAQMIRKVALSVTIFLVTAAAVFIILLLVNPPFVQRKCKEQPASTSSSDETACAIRSSASIWKVSGLALLAGTAAAAIPFAWKHVAPTVGPMMKMF